jgi:hypothetical protein
MTDATTVPGATYTLTVTDSTGAKHAVSYASNIYDGAAQILNGLVLAVGADTDTYWDGDKGALEEQVVPQEAAITEGKFTTMPTPPLTGQQGSLSRYKV